MTEFDGRTEIERKLAEEARIASPPGPQDANGNAEPGVAQAWPPGPLPPTPTAAPPPAKPSTLERWKDKGGVLGTIAAGLLFLVKVFGPIFALLGKLKFLVVFKTIFLTFGSMALSIWAYSTQFGWRFAVGLVLLIFFHECGHAFAGLLKGNKPGIMVFVPFMGAFVTLKGMGRDIEEDAFVGIMGPVFGTIGGLVCVGLFALTHDPFYLSLAYFNFFMNLFNLAPTVPLDGGWIVPLFSPKLLAVGAVLMVVFGFRNPMIWVLGLMSLPRIVSGWKADPKTQPYYAVPTKSRIVYGFAYVGLAAFLGVLMMACHAQLEALMGR
jgi:Zn-dependent protease